MALEKIVFILADKLPTICNLLFQTDDCNINKLKICSNWNCSDKMKVIYAQMSTECDISFEMVQIAVKTICSSIFGNDFYLLVDDRSERDGDTSESSVKGR